LALKQRSQLNRRNQVSPKPAIDTLVNDDTVPTLEGDSDDEAQEGRVIKGQKILYQPSAQEWDDHMRTHIPFRKWCPYCVQGKCVSGAHRRGQKSAEELEREVPVISFDYHGPKSKSDRAAQIDSLPIIGGVDRRRKWVIAHMVPSKGVDAHAVKVITRELRLAGYNRMVLKSDQEPSIKALLEAVKREQGEAVEIQPEESPVGEHQSNGDAENSIRTVQAQTRTMRAALQ